MEPHQDQHRIFRVLAPTKLFFTCAIPSMISMAVTSLYVIADGIFVGRYIGSQALAAVNLVMPFIMMSFALSDMVAVGSSVQISIRLGEGENIQASRIFSFACCLILALSLIVGAGAWVFADDLVRLMGAQQDVADLAVQYMRVYALFSPLIMIFFAVDNYLRICGKVRYSMGMNIAISLGNIALDWLFIVHFGWGIASAALASCIALASGTLICFLPFFRGKMILRFVRPKVKPAMAGNIMANGSSEFFANISGSVYMAIVNAVLLHIAGFQAVAAFSIVLYVDSIVKSMLFGMADSLQPAISYNFGAGDMKRVFALERRVLGAGMTLSLVVLLFMLFSGSTVVSWFIVENDPMLLEMSVRATKLFALSYLVCWFGIATGSFYTALNKPMFSIFVAMGQTLIFPVICLLLLPQIWGLDGVWITAFFASMIVAILSAILMLFVKREFAQHLRSSV